MLKEGEADPEELGGVRTEAGHRAVVIEVTQEPQEGPGVPGAPLRGGCRQVNADLLAASHSRPRQRCSQASPLLRRGASPFY